jgi:large repetitive protein
VALSPGIGEPYVPSAIGPDGTVYTLNGGTLFALGDLVGVRVSLASSVPDVRTVVAGQTLTFSASVSNTGGSGFVPTGTVTLQDTIYFIAGSSTGSSTNLLATMPLDGAGHAAVSTSALSAANHFITAVYSGDSNFSTGRVTLVEDIHAFGSTTTLASSPNPSATGQTVSLTITVAPVPPAHRFRLAR